MQRRAPSSPEPRPATSQPAELSTLVGALIGHIHRRSAGDSLAVMGEAGLSMPQLVTCTCWLTPAAVRWGDRRPGCAPPPGHQPSGGSPGSAGLVARTEDPDDRRQSRSPSRPRGVGLGRADQQRAERRGVGRAGPPVAAVRRQFADVLDACRRGAGSRCPCQAWDRTQKETP